MEMGIDGKLFFTGGNGSDGETITSYIFDGPDFNDGPEFPSEKWGHCQVTLNSTAVFFTNGNGFNTERTYLYHWNKDEFVILDDIIYCMSEAVQPAV